MYDKHHEHGESAQPVDPCHSLFTVSWRELFEVVSVCGAHPHTLRPEGLAAGIVSVHEPAVIPRAWPSGNAPTSGTRAASTGGGDCDERGARGRKSAAADAYGESMTRVTGPSSTRASRMSAPKTPRSTLVPRRSSSTAPVS